MITCDDCDRFYIGQTGRGFEIRFKEHLPKKNNINTKSNYAQHLIDYDHKYTSFSDNLKPLHYCKKGQYMDVMEEYEIYKAHKDKHKHLLNDIIPLKHNVLFETVLSITRDGDNSPYDNAG